MTANVTVSAVTAAVFAAARRTQNALHWPAPIVPNARPAPEVVGAEYDRPVTLAPGATSVVAVSACAVAEPIADAAVLSTATVTTAPPAGSPPDSHRTALVSGRVACALCTNTQRYSTTLFALSAPEMSSNRLFRAVADSCVVEM